MVFVGDKVEFLEPTTGILLTGDVIDIGDFVGVLIQTPVELEGKVVDVAIRDFLHNVSTGKVIINPTKSTPAPTSEPTMVLTTPEPSDSEGKGFGLALLVLAVVFAFAYK